MKKGGFSLIELLIVLIVIAAIIGVVTPLMLNAQAKAKATQVANNLKTIFTAFENRIYIDKTETGVKCLSDVVRNAGDEYELFFYNIDGVDYDVMTLYTGNVSYSFINDLLPDMKEGNGVDGLEKPPDPIGGAKITSTGTESIMNEAIIVVPEGKVYYLQHFPLHQ